MPSRLLSRELYSSWPCLALKSWLILHAFASIFFLISIFVYHIRRGAVFVVDVAVCVHGLAVLYVAWRVALAYTSRLMRLNFDNMAVEEWLANLNRTVSSLRTSRLLAAGAPNAGASGSATAASSRHVSGRVQRMVLYADPSYVNDLDVGPDAEDDPRPPLEQAFSSDENLPTTPSWTEDGTLCIVCQNAFGPEGAHVLGTCGHAFHPPCLANYSKVKRHCYCDVPIHQNYYISTCALDHMPPDSRDKYGRSVLQRLPNSRMRVGVL